MAACMKQYDIPCRDLLQRSLHGLKIHVLCFRRVVRITVDHKSCTGKDGAMVVPAGVADPDPGFPEIGCKKIRANLQGAGTAYGLRRGDTLLGNRLMFLSEQQMLHLSPVTGCAF